MGRGAVESFSESEEHAQLTSNYDSSTSKAPINLLLVHWFW